MLIYAKIKYKVGGKETLKEFIIDNYMTIGMIFIIIVITIIKLEEERNNERMIKNSKILTNYIPLPYDFPIMDVRNKEEFNNVWEVIIDKLYEYDRNRNVLAVNQWSYYTVKYYTEAVLKYGNAIQKKALRNFVKLIERNRLI